MQKSAVTAKIMSEPHKSIRCIVFGSYAFLVPAAIFLLAAVYFASNTFSLFDFPLDDAWTHRVYSSSFAFGHGFQYNEGVQEAGSTSPLWAVLTCPAHWLELFGTRAVVVAVKAIAILLCLVSICAVQKIARHASGSRAAGIIAASLFALEPRLLFSALSGMEAPLLLSLWLCASWAFVLRKWWLSVLLFSLTPVTRPEALVILPLYIAALLVATGRKKWNIKQGIIWVIPLLPMLLWCCFCKFTNGHFLPNAFYLKAQSFHLGAHELAISCRAPAQHGLAPLHIFFIVLAVFLAWSVIHNTFITRSLLLFLVLAPIAYLLGVAGTRDVNFGGYYWTRWLDPASLILAVPFCVGCALVISGVVCRTQFIWNRLNTELKKRILSLLTIGLGFVGLLYSIPYFYNSFTDRRHHIASDSRAIHLMNVQVGKWIRENTTEDATVGVNDAGAIRYFGQRRTIDLIGLNNADVAFRPASRPRILGELDWVAIFPSVFKGSDIFNYFEPRTSFHIPLQEYTICDCPGQTTIVILERKSPTAPRPL
ncbi:MAG: hypothetical protein ACYSSO_01135 [Planctomycetota bacterium]